jgi:hypothetical protein
LTNVTVTATLSQSVASSITVMGFTGVNTSGTNGSGAIGSTKSASASSGAPAATLVTTQNGSWVFGAGNDFDNAIARTPGTGQSLVHQYLTPAGDTYWVQMQNAPTPLSGTSVSINDTAPTTDRYNLGIVEVLPAASGGSTFSISGTVTPSSLGSGTVLTLSGSGTQVTADGSGSYTFSNLANGTYTITPNKSGLSFNPASQTVTVNGLNVTGTNFTVQTWSISGTVSPSGSGTLLTLSGTSTGTATADVSGNYSFTGLLNGSYTVTPSKTGYTFSPANQPVTISSANVTSVNFTATPPATYSISGTVSPASLGSGTVLTLSGAASATATADSSGNYTFANLLNGTYTLSPSKSGLTFSPSSQMVTINGSSISGTNFSVQTWSISGTITPSTAASGATVALTGAATGTATPDGSGNYSFSGLISGSYTVTPSNSGYSFSPPSQPVTVASANVTGISFTGQQGAPVQLSMDVHISKDQSTNSTTATTAAFSTASGNELLLALISTDYLSGTNTTVQSVSGGGLTWVMAVRANGQSGTSEIWRAFASAPLTNVSVTATLSQSVQSSMTIISFTGVDTSGTNGSGAIGASGSGSKSTGAPTASLVTTRNGSWVFGAGNDFDNAIARTPGTGQSLVHQYLTPAGDTYWVQMQNAPTPLSGTSVSINDTAPTTDRYNLSVVEVLPSSSGGTATPPTISMTSPAPNVTLANRETISATANGQGYPITGVQFLLDGNNLGAQLTTTPYSLVWDTTTTTPGTHQVSAVAYNSAGLSTTSNPVTVTVDNSGNPVVVGSWSSVVSLPTVAVNLVLLKNNTVLLYQDGSSPTIWDYVNNAFTSVPAPVDLFCSGHAVFADGRVLVVGGYGESGSMLGIPNAEIFDPINKSWTVVPKMSYSRWYPTATTLSDGRVMVTAGWQTTNHTNAGIPEIYDPSTNAWTKLTNANNPFETYPFVYQLSDGRVVHVGGSEYAVVTDILNINTQTWSIVDPNIVDGGSSSMYLPGKIMKAGSATDSQGSGPSANTTFVLDMTQASPAWQQTPSMVYPRSFLNLTTLPDGTVLTTGGETDKNGGNISNAVYAAELWSPQTQTWTTMSSMHTPREYHATALLLPDGRVMVSGMGADFGQVPNEMSAEFYSPPYLFKGARPSITQTPAQISYGQNFFVATPDGPSITSAVLIRTGAVTHFFDQNTRFVPVSFQQTSGGLTLTAPATSNLAPPGYYMLFVVNSNGVPSIAPFVQLQ